MALSARIDKSAHMTLVLGEENSIHSWRGVLLGLRIPDTVNPHWHIQGTNVLIVDCHSSLALHTKEGVFCLLWGGLILIWGLPHHIVVAKRWSLLLGSIPVRLTVTSVCLILVMIPYGSVEQSVDSLSFWLVFILVVCHKLLHLDVIK